MSAGAFSNVTYEANAGSFHPLRCQPESLALVVNGVTNAAPTDAINNSQRAQVSKNNRSSGLKARRVVVRFTGTVPTGYATGGLYTIPVPDPDVFNGIVEFQTGTYLGEAIEVVSLQPEIRRS